MPLSIDAYPANAKIFIEDCASLKHGGSDQFRIGVTWSGISTERSTWTE
jgi:hypothetical protein